MAPFFGDVSASLERYIVNAGFQTEPGPEVSAPALLLHRTLQDVFVEARLRLEQLDYLIEHIQELEQQRMTPRPGDRLPMLVLLHSEAFYYIAARLGSLLKNKNHEAFGLQGYSCPLVRRIRDWMIEHPEKPNGNPLVQWSWQHDDGRGPVLEGRKSQTGKVIDDPGLFKNAELMRQRLLEAIARADERVSTTPYESSAS